MKLIKVALIIKISSTLELILFNSWSLISIDKDQFSLNKVVI